MQNDEIIGLLGSIEEAKTNQTFVELSQKCVKLFSLLDNQEDLPEPLRKSIWKLYLKYSQYQQLLKS